METREETADFVRSFALNQFHKKHSFSEDTSTVQLVQESLIKNIQLVKVQCTTIKRGYRYYQIPKVLTPGSEIV